MTRDRCDRARHLAPQRQRQASSFSETGSYASVLRGQGTSASGSPRWHQQLASRKQPQEKSHHLSYGQTPHTKPTSPVVMIQYDPYGPLMTSFDHGSLEHFCIGQNRSGCCLPLRESAAQARHQSSSRLLSSWFGRCPTRPSFAWRCKFM